MTMNERISELIHSDLGPGTNDISRATSPGADWEDTNGDINGRERKQLRHRPRTFPYFKHLPYGVETQDEREKNLDTCIEHLYICISAGDFAPGAVHWTREIRAWLSLKFDLPRETRVRLVRLYYELALAPGLDYIVAERFASMFMVLTKRKHYLRPGKDLTLDWRPLFKELKMFVFPTESESNINHSKRNIRTLTKICTFAQLYFDSREIPVMLEEFLPYFSTSIAESAYVVAGLLNLLLPTAPPPEDEPELQPQHYLPTFFHLWSLVNRSRIFDVHLIDILSRLARDSLPAKHVPFSQYGIFTREQSALVFTAILRLLEIPVGQSSSPYSNSVDLSAGIAIVLDRDQRKHPVAHHIARWIVMSLSPECLDQPDSILAKMEGLFQAIETFYHPSNSGSWTKTLSQLVYYCADFFVMRWNRENSGEMEVPDERRLTPEISRRFVRCLREVVFMGIFGKSSAAVNFSLSTLQSLAFLAPDLILPGALQRIYPAMQGLVEVHRTISSIRALQMLSKTLCRERGFRCHVTALLALALPGIDANDLEKTLHTLAFIQAVCYNIPFQDLTKGASIGSDHSETSSQGELDSGLALAWITDQVDKMELEGPGVEFNYAEELSSEQEAFILRSSTAGFAEFVLSFLGRVFTLLENLPDASRVRSGSPEENVVNTLPATFTPLLAALSEDLFDMALNKVAQFVTNHVIHQARDAMAFICNALVKVSPKKALERLLPDLIAGIRIEIDENGAGSTRTTGTEVLPRDRALVWNISLLSMCVVHVGDPVLQFKKELFDLATYMQHKCKGIPTVHVSNFVHHLLLNLTVTYTEDYTIFTRKEIENGLTVAHWGATADLENLDIRWHVPKPDEISFAVELFEAQAMGAINALEALTSSDSPVKRDGTGKDWSDEVSRNLVLLRLIISGISVLFDPRYQQDKTLASEDDQDVHMENGVDDDNADDDEKSLGEADDEEVKPTFQYETGYPLERGGEQYLKIHRLRGEAGHVLHRVHQFLTDRQEDDVTCFNALYNAYRSWFVDVGIERSAHVLDRVTRLLAADIHPFKFSGLRKQYPRSLLVRRANVYHLQRLRHNANPRPKTELEQQLLLDLAQSSVSLYTEIRRTAQSANESAVKCIIGSRTSVIPSLLEALEKAVKENDFPRIKGAMFSLLFGSLAKTISRNWRFAPTLIKAFIEVSGVDKPSVQKLSSNATYQIMDMGKPLERQVILDEDIIESISPSSEDKQAHDVQDRIESKAAFIKRKREKVEGKKRELSLDLIQLASNAHWKKACRTAAIILSCEMRYETIASGKMIDLVTRGSIDPHPSLRGLYAGALITVFSLINTRALTKHDYKNLLLGEEHLPDKIDVPTENPESGWTARYLESFAKPKADYYVDQDYPGWLVWGKKMPAFNADAKPIEYDSLEQDVRFKIGQIVNRHWFSTMFAYMKQEPRDQGADRFRMTTAILLSHAFELVLAGLSEATFDDLKDMTQSVYGNGTDKHQHRATAEILGALLSIAPDFGLEVGEKIWNYAFPIIRGIFQDGLTPENLSYWTSFLRLVLQTKDPRRNWRLVEWLASFRLDMSSNAAFKESSKIQLLQQCIIDAGWHFQLEKPLIEDFMSHLDHPYKGVREALGQTLANIYRTRYHESYPDISSLVKTQKSASSIGTRPYEPTEQFSSMVRDTFERLEAWRKERTPGQQTPSAYTSGGKTVLLWIECTLSSYECTQLVKFFPGNFMEQLLHMMDIKEDPELQSLAYHVFRHLPNVPHRADEEAAFVSFLMHTGRHATSWHQRLRVLINIQVIYFRHLFLTSEAQQLAVFDCVSAMLGDSQLEVRLGASTTLSGMVRCSPLGLRTRVVHDLKARFTDSLVQNPLPRRRTPGTPTPEQNRLILARHAAVLGLGALIQAFPYTSPPPPWLPGVLATLAVKAAGDSGMVGKSVKSILADFKKTRQDTWHVDVKAFEPEQLEDLEGVLWKSYFA